MEKRVLLSRAKQYGLQQKESNSILARLALDAATCAREGHIDTSDVWDVYAAYLNGVTGATNPDGSEQSNKVQASKLRQIVKLAEENPSAMVLLLKVIDIYNTTNEGNYKPLYMSMCDVAREQRKHGRRALTDGQITATMTR
jgi:hypothetical protein